jgi:hypothetical protein
MNFKKTNNIVGWAVGLIACAVFILTAEAGGSFWDCGEFVSSCYKLQIPHPPGAPLFVLLGRFFIILFGDNPLTAAKAVNVMSALASGFTVLFLFWTITHFARRIANVDVKGTMTKAQAWSIMGAGAVGALAYTFSDSFWYSAVEGEVYALSSFFSAIVFWAALKWDNAAAAEEEGADRWLVFLFFLIGLSIGVHLLCILNIPAVVMIYYFRRRDSFNYSVIRRWFLWIVGVGGFIATILAYRAASKEESALTQIDGIAEYLDKNGWQASDSTLVGLMLVGTLGAIGLLYLVEYLGKKKKEYYGGIYIFFLIGFVLLGVVQIAVIQYSVAAAGAFDKTFVNDMHMPFFSGFAIFFVLLALLIAAGLYFAKKKQWAYLRLGLWSFTFMLIGYSSYVTTMIRSNADPAIDMYNVDNPMSLVGYLGRDQYGDFPLLYGQKYTARPVSSIEGSERFQKSANQYITVGRNFTNVYLPKDKMVLPRVWDASNDQYHATYYGEFLNIRQDQQSGQYVDAEGNPTERPNQADNIKFFAGYQFYWMYLRYFMWNFSGKQNDVQGMAAGNIRDGNWITGVTPIDNLMYGDQSALPDTLKNNKAHNKLFALPLILGLIGLFYHFRKKGDDALSTFLFFFFTGFAIILYLNQAGYQPRERDYAFVGSFYVFAIWIGLSVMSFVDFAQSRDKTIVKTILTGCGIVAIAAVVAAVVGNATSALAPAVVIMLYIAAVSLALLYLFSFIYSSTKNLNTTAIAITIVCIVAVPVVMAQQEWDDHDRSNKTLPRDLAKNYLQSCDKNAILFTFGDNDTYPLWYAQEVEGIRPDIRVINTSLLGIDWYINQLRYKVNNSDAIDLIWSSDQIEGAKRNIVAYNKNSQYSDSAYYDLLDILKNYAGDDKSLFDHQNYGRVNGYPTTKFSVPVDAALVKTNGTVNANDSVVSAMKIDVPKVLDKGNSAILSVIAANKWKRPIYFTSKFGQLGFGKYLRQDGLSYRLVPVENDPINADKMYAQVMSDSTWGFGNANKPGVYYDEENRRHLLSIREAIGDLASALADKGEKDKASKVLHRADSMMLQENFPYGMASRFDSHNGTAVTFLEGCYKSGDSALTKKVSAALRKDIQQQTQYYKSLDASFIQVESAYTKALNSNNIQSFAQGIDQFLYNNLTGKLKAMMTDVYWYYRIRMRLDMMEKSYQNPLAALLQMQTPPPTTDSGAK